MLLSAYGIVFTAALSISIGANIRVGNLLGAGDPIAARKAAVAALRLALSSAMLVGLGLGLGRRLWPRVYGVSDSMMELVSHLAPVYAAVQVSQRRWEKETGAGGRAGAGAGDLGTVAP